MPFTRSFSESASQPFAKIDTAKSDVKKQGSKFGVVVAGNRIVVASCQCGFFGYRLIYDTGGHNLPPRKTVHPPELTRLISVIAEAERNLSRECILGY